MSSQSKRYQHTVAVEYLDQLVKDKTEFQAEEDFVEILAELNNMARDDGSKSLDYTNQPVYSLADFRLKRDRKTFSSYIGCT